MNFNLFIYNVFLQMLVRGGYGGECLPKGEGVAWGEIKPKNCPIRAVFGRGVRAVVRGIF